MLDSVYVGLTGLTSFSDGLKTISNNVANMNTVGYKLRQSQFSDLYYRFQAGSGGSENASPYTNGSGVAHGGEFLNQKQGELRSTGNDLDAALDGSGYFILRDNKGEFYTRDGQFDVAADGYLVARGSEKRVLFLDDNGALQPLNVHDFQRSQAQATKTIKFNNSLLVSDTNPYSVNVTVFDALGGSHTLAIKFTPNNAVSRSWSVTVSENGTVLHTGEVRFDASGTPTAGFESFAFDYKPSETLDPISLTLDFTNANASSSLPSNIALMSQDGFTDGALTKTSFDADGSLVFSYSNDQKKNGPRLALANFAFPSGLEAVGNNLFANTKNEDRFIGRAGESIFGKVTSGSVEASNVDLAGQFSELIIVQRGYQASSQVITTANEMIQQLLDMRGK